MRILNCEPSALVNVFLAHARGSAFGRLRLLHMRTCGLFFTQMGLLGACSVALTLHLLSAWPTASLPKTPPFAPIEAPRRAELAPLLTPPLWHAGNPIMLPASFFPEVVRHEEHCDTFQASDFICFIEWDEWLMSYALVTSHSAILELGARWGTTSCFLSQFQNNSGRIVAVEPQADAHARLLSNRDAHHCNFYTLMGILGPQPLRFHADGYGSMTSHDGEVTVPNIEFDELESLVGFRFDTLLFDCEGCIQDVLPLEEHQPLLKNIALILMEEDMADHLRHEDKYRHWHLVFVRAGFQSVWHSHDTHAPREARWSWTIRHHAWIRPHLYGPTWTGCDAFALTHTTDVRSLQCVGAAWDGNPLYPRPP